MRQSLSDCEAEYGNLGFEVSSSVFSERSPSSSGRSPRSGYGLALPALEGVVGAVAGRRRLVRISSRPSFTALDAGTSKAAVSRSFGVARSTLIDTLARAGWTGPGSVS
jgi:hypothetical protein